MMNLLVTLSGAYITGTIALHVYKNYKSGKKRRLQFKQFAETV